MKGKIITLLMILAAAMMVGNAMAVPSGKKVTWDTSGGKVIFDGKVHADKGLKCNACHPKPFAMKKSAAMKMADLNAGKYCGVCHNGTKAFNTTDEANCGKCHQK